MAMEGGGGGTLSELYQHSKRLLLTTRDGLERLERLEFSTSKGGVDSPELSFAVKRDIGQIQLLCVEMDRFWRSIAAKSQRDLWKRKVEQVAEEAGSLKESLDMYLSRNQRRTQEARERAELLGRVNGESSHVLTIFDEEAQAMQSARNSSRMLEESYATGVAILSQYAGQRNQLKLSFKKQKHSKPVYSVQTGFPEASDHKQAASFWLPIVDDGGSAGADHHYGGSGAVFDHFKQQLSTNQIWLMSSLISSLFQQPNTQCITRTRTRTRN